MSSINKSVLAAVVTCTVAVAALTSYFIFHFRKIPRNGAKKPQKSKGEGRLSCVTRFQKENLEPEVAGAIEEFLSSSDVSVRQGFLLMLHQASAFTLNHPVIRCSGCLDRMLNLLDADSMESKVQRQNLVILQTVTNLACDQSSLDILADHMETIFKIGSTTDYSDQACAALQLLCNVALTAKGCRLLDCKSQRLLEMLATHDAYMLRQILSILINLSCDATSLELILQAVVPNGLLETFFFALSPSVQPLISLQAVNLMRNLYSSIYDRRNTRPIRRTASTGHNMVDFLLVSMVF
ncbi:hypothetical protein FBUS_09708 [Fasciolopsis buskii]|uniref:Armadillo repeat-containing domain-containing protein n=1 Tax=Fasciolopsis buskii TaxID=27845 RepID=A0A8E0RNK4_9TREM|nr:hypothetical protein FBUS_09708 [Fasciolopsis buski]